MLVSWIIPKKIRLGAQSVTLLITLRDPTQLRQRQCATKVPLVEVWYLKKSNSYCSSEGRNGSDKKVSLAAKKSTAGD